MSINWLQRTQELLTWAQPPTRAGDWSFQRPVHIRWFEDGRLNVAVNCLDRHLSDRADQPAIIWEPDSESAPGVVWTYAELHGQCCRWANALTAMGVKAGDRVTIYLPMIPDAVAVLLACARLGAIHNVVFAGFSAESLAERIQNCDSRWVITAVEGRRGGKVIPLLETVRTAVDLLEHRPDVVVLGGASQSLRPGEVGSADLLAKVTSTHSPESFPAESGLFILYTSGSTNKPKGVYHTMGGYLTYASHTFQEVFQVRRGEVFWCTADIGWITGHSYVVYGPLAAGATLLIYEGVPTWPQPDRIWKIVDKHQVSTLYTAPTALRALMREGPRWLESTKRDSLRVLGTVGEPINPEAWRWYFEEVGRGRCPVVDTWWQTETGGILISATAEKPCSKAGSASQPLPGVEPVIVNERGLPLEGPTEGHLCLRTSWPGQMRTVYGDHDRFEQTYFTTYPGFYFTGDGCRRDSDGDYWITGRVDDVLNVSGHRLGTAEIESALVAHPAVAEAAVVGIPHAIKGQGVYAFVILREGVTTEPSLTQELKASVVTHIGALARPDVVQVVPGLPKTRSGKIMRRILRKLVEGAADQLGDTSTLADPTIVEQIRMGLRLG